LNQRLRHAAVAQLTTNLDDKDDPSCFLIEAATPEGQAAGIIQDSVFSGYLLSLMSDDGCRTGLASGRMEPCGKRTSV
jgi:hypothetical protein